MFRALLLVAFLGAAVPVSTAPVAPVSTAPVAPVSTAPATPAPVTAAPVTTPPVTTPPVAAAPVNDVKSKKGKKGGISRALEGKRNNQLNTAHVHQPNNNRCSFVSLVGDDDDDDDGTSKTSKKGKKGGTDRALEGK